MSELGGAGQDAVAHQSLERSLEEERRVHQDPVLEEGADPDDNGRATEQAEREL
ncbi:MAG: hypothetical protein ACMG6E_09325 [Candidatus Roizmanbacteria bacterium]